MPFSIWSLLKLYGPILFSIIFLALVFFIRREQEGGRVRLKALGDLLELELPIRDTLIARGLLILASIISFCILFLWDYTSFFPKRLEMEVFFDRAGIERTLSSYSKQELEPFNIPSDYEKWQSKYYDDLDAELQKILNLPYFFSIQEGIVHSQGEVEFTIEQVRGWQEYHFKEAQGELFHILEVPGEPNKEFISIFRKLPTRQDYFHVSIRDILLRHGKLLCPVFKQILTNNLRDTTIPFHHAVVGLIKASSFPFPDVADTIYLANIKNDIHVPIAYAVYK